MIILNLNWSMHQTEMAITYLGKLNSDIILSTEDATPEMGFGTTLYTVNE